MATSDSEGAGRAPAPLGRRVRALLETMGGEPDAIARHLGDMGVRGEPRDPSGCAIASYLSSVVAGDPEVRSVRVSHRSVVVRREHGWRWTVVKLPNPVRLFVSAFDTAAYPHLVRPASRPRLPIAGRPESAGKATPEKQAP